jgi:hypothetical protein
MVIRETIGYLGEILFVAQRTRGLGIEVLEIKK